MISIVEPFFFNEILKHILMECTYLRSFLKICVPIRECLKHVFMITVNNVI